jgi:hypothetical protein
VQIKVHMAEVKEKMAQGKKWHSDAGQSHGGKRKASNKENIQPTKKAKCAQMQLPPKSNKIIMMDDEDDDEPEEELQEGGSDRL